MTDTIDLAALDDAIRQAQSEADAAERAATVPGHDWRLRHDDWLRATTRHATLIEAGLIVTLGKGEDT